MGIYLSKPQILLEAAEVQNEKIRAFLRKSEQCNGKVKERVWSMSGRMIE
jgi:hypothetical protein